MRPVAKDRVKQGLARKQRLPFFIRIRSAPAGRNGIAAVAGQQLPEQFQLVFVLQVQRKRGQAVFLFFADPAEFIFNQAADIFFHRGVRFDERGSAFRGSPGFVDQAEGQFSLYQEGRQLQRGGLGGQVGFFQLGADLFPVPGMISIDIAGRKSAVASGSARYLLDCLGIQTDLFAVDMLGDIPEYNPLDIVVLPDGDRVGRDEAVCLALLEFARLLHLDLVGELAVDDRWVHALFLEPGSHLVGADPGENDIGVIAARSLVRGIFKNQRIGALVFNHFISIAAEANQPLCDVQPAHSAADIDRVGRDSQDGIRIKGSVFPGDQLAFIDHSRRVMS